MSAEKCPHFKAPEVEFEVKLGEGPVPHEVDFGDALEVRYDVPHHVYRRVTVYDGNENGDNIPVDIMGLCNTEKCRTISDMRALTKECFDKYCNTSDHQSCPRFIKKVETTDSSPNSGI